jgi:hypothetical protein
MAIQIRSTPSSRMGSKAGMSHVVRFYSMLKISWSPTGTNRLDSHFFAHSPTRSKYVFGDGQSALVNKLGVCRSRSRLLIGPDRYHPRPKAALLRQQSHPVTTTSLSIYNVPIVQGAGWAPQPIWTQRLDEKSFRLCRGSNFDRPVVQPVARHYTDWATRLTKMHTHMGPI